MPTSLMPPDSPTMCRMPLPLFTPSRWEAADPRLPSDVTAHDPLSTVGAALLWSGLDDDLAVLHQEVLVLRPTNPMGANVVAYAR